MPVTPGYAQAMIDALADPQALLVFSVIVAGGSSH
jgi:hypothetical protein